VLEQVKKVALAADDDDDGLDPPPPASLLATATASFLHRYFAACPWLQRLNASNNAGVPGVLILKKPAYEPGDVVEVLGEEALWIVLLGFPKLTPAVCV
jgi:hypothetical protein